jgi:putative redox protein
MYANRKEWPLKGVIVSLTREKAHFEDSSHPVDADARVDAVDQTVKLVGRLTEEQRERLMVIAGRCPVHKTLDARMRIRTEADLS